MAKTISVTDAKKVLKQHEREKAKERAAKQGALKKDIEACRKQVVDINADRAKAITAIDEQIEKLKQQAVKENAKFDGQVTKVNTKIRTLLGKYNDIK